MVLTTVPHLESELGPEGNDVCVPPPASSTAPSVTLSAPLSGSTFTEGDAVNLTATATDAEEGDLTASLTWTSNLDGALGGGGSLVLTTLSVGIHTIVASLTDGGGVTGKKPESDKKKPGPEPEHLKIDGDWKEAVKKVIKSPPDAEEGDD